MNRHGLTTRFAFLLVATVSTVLAQTTGSIEGAVYDPDGRVAPRTAVRLTATETSAERRLATNENGRYLAPGLAPGVYDITVSHPGLRGQVRRGVEVAAGRSTRVDFHLELGEARQAVEVVGTAPLISTDTADWGGTVGRRKLDSLPLNGRDLFDLSAQESGATLPANATTAMTRGLGIHISANGARPNQNSFRMDGIYVNDASYSAPTSAAGRTLGVEGIQEIRLVTSPFSAEYGRAAGAIFTAVSRSGSNKGHGSLYSFIRNSALDAKNYFDAADEPIPPLRKYQFGGSLGGAIRRDKVFYFLNYEGIRQGITRTARSVTLTEEARQGKLPGPGGLRTVPVAEEVKPFLELYPLPNGRDFGDGTAELAAELDTSVREDYAAGKLDFVLSDRVRLAGRYTFDDGMSTEPDPFRIWSLDSDSRYQFVHTDTQFIVSPTTIHNLRTGFARIHNLESSRVSPDIPASLSFVPGEPLGFIWVTGLTPVGGIETRFRPRKHLINDVQGNYEVTLIRDRHSIRLGAGYDYVRFLQVADNNRPGLYSFGSVADLLTATTRYGDLMAPGSDTVRNWRQHQIFAFAQDEMRFGPRFSLTLGLRYEAYSSPAEADGKIATLRDPIKDTELTVGGPLFDNPSTRNLAPRAALAWDPTGSGKTVVRAGAGIFFDLLGARELVIAGVRMPPFFNRLVVQGASFPDLVDAAKDAEPDPTLDGLDYYLQQPYVAQFQLALQRRIGASVMVELGYAGARGVHLVGQMSNANPTHPVVLTDGRLFFPSDGQPVNPAFARIGLRRSQFNSFYHGLLASVERRWSRGFRVQAKYAFSKAIDETSVAVFSDFEGVDQVPTMYNYRLNRGPASFDLRHAFALNFSYELPAWPGRTANALFGGWEISGLARAQSGHPFAPRVGYDRARLGWGFDLGQRPDLAAAPGASTILGDPQRYFDPSAFSLPEAGFYGNLGRGTLIGPGLATLDAALHKTVWRGERQSVRLRIEAFNVTNHPNFQLPSQLALFNRQGQRLGSAGQITSTTTSSRQIQIAAKWVF